ncbi:hypothetical protein EV688_11951 [Chromatocurvus halotolerans]|uniref:Uncharacterized protein n=1 Tax=Chromatocurvus halotolerans TaxID=1132028 RepID=A0A4R2KN85_9GAMM|nr:hypothetical protein EV688_11951 [Chromatocurvus halotolerans]
MIYAATILTSTEHEQAATDKSDQEGNCADQQEKATILTVELLQLSPVTSASDHVVNPPMLFRESHGLS